MIVEPLEQKERYDAENLIKEVFFTSGNRSLTAVQAKAYLEELSLKGGELLV